MAMKDGPQRSTKSADICGSESWCSPATTRWRIEIYGKHESDKTFEQYRLNSVEHFDANAF